MTCKRDVEKLKIIEANKLKGKKWENADKMFMCKKTLQMAKEIAENFRKKEVHSFI